MAPYLTPAGFAALADAQVGKPYVLGAEAQIGDPNPPKFDCSELIEWLYGRNGTPIGDLAASQFNKTYPITNPKVGDLVFLKNNPLRSNGIGHVAVLTKKLSNGDWRIIEARGRNYGVVRSTLSYWKSRAYYAGIRRFKGFSLITMDPIPSTEDHLFRVGIYNTQKPGWGGNSLHTADGEFVRDDMRCSLFGLMEATEANRNAVRRVHGYRRFITWPNGLVAPVWDKERFTWTDHDGISFGTAAARAEKVDFLSKVNSSKFVFCAVHIRPTAVTDDRGKIDDINKLVRFLADDRNVIVGGDWNTESARRIMEFAGYTLATPWIPTVDGTKKKYDAIYVKGPALEIRNLYGPAGPGKFFNPDDLSDHLGGVANVTLKG